MRLGEDDIAPGSGGATGPQTAIVSWTAPTVHRKGVSHAVAAAPGTIDDDTCATLLAAIAHSKAWVGALMMALPPYSPRLPDLKTWQKNTFAPSHRWLSSHPASSRQFSMEMFGRG